MEGTSTPIQTPLLETLNIRYHTARHHSSSPPSPRSPSPLAAPPQPPLVRPFICRPTYQLTTPTTPRSQAQRHNSRLKDHPLGRKLVYGRRLDRPVVTRVPVRSLCRRNLDLVNAHVICGHVCAFVGGCGCVSVRVRCVSLTRRKSTVIFSLHFMLHTHTHTHRTHTHTNTHTHTHTHMHTHIHTHLNVSAHCVGTCIITQATY
jgi:hypothetical protein